MLFFGDAECHDSALFESRDGFAFEVIIRAHHDGEKAEEGGLQAVAVGRAEVGDEFDESAEAEQIEGVAEGGEFFGGED